MARYDWKELYDSMDGCTKCRLCEQRNSIVIGEGDPSADIMFVGEGPGRDEDLSGRPFVGPAGKLLDKMIISGANTRPDAVSKALTLLFKLVNFLHKKPLFALMLTEPHITATQLEAIDTPTLVLAGSKDLVCEEDTRFIAGSIPHATLRILPGEGHASYIVHRSRIAELILDYCLR